MLGAREVEALRGRGDEVCGADSWRCSRSSEVCVSDLNETGSGCMDLCTGSGDRVNDVAGDVEGDVAVDASRVVGMSGDWMGGWTEGAVSSGAAWTATDELVVFLMG